VAGRSSPRHGHAETRVAGLYNEECWQTLTRAKNWQAKGTHEHQSQT